MAKDRKVQRYTADAMHSSFMIDRETYKNIKHMDKVQLANYLEAIYKKAYEKGFEAGKKAGRIAPQIK